ncbi:MAG: flagellar biosynthesis repressor FlbT [Alphaproteobacteria bacterium]|nr:flagellar biosynthesis repressor FlbT [Alphaproteobacteria bacterium]
MPLKIRVKPEGKILAGGAVLKNVGNRPADLLVLSDSPVLREGYMMNIDRRDESDVSSVYFLLQVIYLFRGKDKPMDTFVVETVKSFAKLYPHFEADATQIIAHLEARESFKALKVAHSMLGQYEKSVQNDPAKRVAPLPVSLQTMEKASAA